MTANGEYQFDVQEVEYLKHGDKPLIARTFKPRGDGPFPLMVSLHGGAWCRESRMTDEKIHENLAKAGIAVISLDFRMPPDAPYPGSMQDINYGIRWAKSRAASLGSRPDLIGVMGTSSGGHQAMLTAMRPRDARYAALPLAGEERQRGVRDEARRGHVLTLTAHPGGGNRRRAEALARHGVRD